MSSVLDWLTKYSPPVVLLIALGAAVLFLAKLIAEKSIAPYFDEKLRALKYQQYFKYAHGILHPDETRTSPNKLKKLAFRALPFLLKKDVPRRVEKALGDDTKRAEKALGILAELARNYPYRTQEIIDDICAFVSKRWNKNQSYEANWNGVLVTTLRLLSSFPKSDQNQNPYYVELTKLRFQDIDLKGFNFEYFVLWETEFAGVNMTRSNFRNTDLGGCIFSQGISQVTSVEWCDFSCALMNAADNKVATTFNRVRLWGSNFDEARIDRCKMIISDGFNTNGIKAKFGDRLEVWS